MQTFISSYPLLLFMEDLENGGKRTTITVARSVKNRFLRKIIGAPKKFKSADEAMTALMDKYEEKGLDHVG